MKNLGYYNGTIGLLEEMTVPMLDRACYFGDGIYEAAATRNHIPYALEEHIERFYRSAAMLRMEVPYTPVALAELLRSLVQKVEGDNLLLYWQLSRGVGIRSHVFPAAPAPASLWVMIQPYTMYDLSKPMAVITAEDLRYQYCNIKTINLLPNVLLAQQALDEGCQEVIWHRGGRVTECTHSNVHILRDGAFWTAPADNLILNGIARRQLIAACAALGVPIHEEPYTLAELLAADEILVTSTGALCAQVSSADGKAVGGKAPELLKKLQGFLTERFLAATEAR